jgi:hypothetical protein
LLLIMTTFIAQPIVCKAAVCWAPNQPLKVESIIVAPPKKGEVLVILLYPVITPQSLIVILLYCYMRLLMAASVGRWFMILSFGWSRSHAMCVCLVVAICEELGYGRCSRW